MPESVTDPTPTKKRRRWWRWSLRILLVLLLAFCIFRFVVHQRVANRINAIRAAGYPVTLEELDAWYTYPDGPNAADVYQRAFEAYVKDEGLEESLPVFGKSVRLPLPGEAFQEDVLQRMDMHVSKNGQAIKLLEEAMAMDACRFPIDLSLGTTVSTPHYRELRYGTRLLQIQSLLEANRGNYDRAVDRCVKLFLLARSLDNEPLVLSSLVRVSILRPAFDQAAWLIQSDHLDDALIKELEQAIDNVQTDKTTLRTVAGERSVVIAMYDHPAVSLYNIRDVLKGDIPGPRTRAAIEALWNISGLLDLDQAEAIDLFNAMASGADERVWPIPTLDDRLDHVPSYYPMTQFCKPDPSLVLLPLEVQTKRSVFLTGLAARAYRDRYGRLPTQLNDLAPEFLNAVPKDPFADQPLRYRVEADGAIIYSIGRDQIDNSGRKQNKIGPKYGDGTDITFTIGGLQEKLWPSGEDKGDDEQRE